LENPISENAQAIKVQLHALVRLQELDNEALHRRRLIESLHQKEKVGTDSQTAQQKKVAKLKSDLESLLKDRRQSEVDSKEKLEAAKKMGDQLFSVKTNEAYNTLQSEIQHKKQENGLLEERILEMMMAEEELRAEIGREEKALGDVDGQVKNLHSADEQEIAILEKQIEDYQAQWEIAAKDVRADFLDLYKRLRDAKGGQAMSKIEHDICTGCRLTIRAQAAIELQKYRTLLFCDNCARILYID
jgi:predicted  nucleic acid-binding Zn-ribbon protein